MRGAWSGLGMYAAGHAAIDAPCAVLLWGGVHDHLVSSRTAWSAFVLYNLLAFAAQPVIGLVVDRLHIARWMAVAGAVVTAAALPLATQSRGFAAAAIVAGFGNALYHVGGGTLSLRFSPGRALPPGVFVAPGAAGLALGILAGNRRDGPHGSTTSTFRPPIGAVAVTCSRSAWRGPPCGSTIHPTSV